MRLLLSLLVLSLISSFADGQQLMAPNRLEAFRASLPMLEDEEAHEQLHNPDLILYTVEDIPPAYQKQNTGQLVGNNGTGYTTFHDPWWNISNDASDRGKFEHGNWALEFPWRAGRPGLAHLATSASSVKGFYFPGKPAVVFHRNVPGRKATSNRTILLDWVFPEGTYFMEVLYQRLGGLDTAFEVRTRIKRGDEWEFGVHRPFDTAEALAEALEEMEPTETRLAAIADLRSDKPLKYRRLADDSHYTKRAFDVSTYTYQVPMLTRETIVKLLDRPFVECMGTNFKGEAPGPDNYTKYASIVPANYFGSHATPTGTSADCISCHESAGQHGTLFQVNRGAYGRLPGSWSEGINSWHPVEPSAISPNGGWRTPRLRKSFVDNGLVVFVRDKLPAGYKFTKKDN